MRGQAAIANARPASYHHLQTRWDPRWRELAAAGAHPQRPWWASTGVEGAAYPDTRYVTDLVAPGVVNTMPQVTLDAVADHAHIPAANANTGASQVSTKGTREHTQGGLDQLAEVGVDYDDVVNSLERDGLVRFDASWDELSGQLSHEMTTAEPAQRTAQRTTQRTAQRTTQRTQR